MLLGATRLQLKRARRSDSNIGAVMLECTTLPPYAADIKEITGLPVFDFVACVEWMHRALNPTRYRSNTDIYAR